MSPIRLVRSSNLNVLLPLLRDAEEGDDRVIAAVEDVMTSAYLALDGERRVGAAVVRWSADASEILYVATVKALRGRGYGKAIISALIDEARNRNFCSIFVGTANASLSNIAFYQKCGFRINSVRKDFFAYFPAPVYENGILIRDMLVLRCDLDA